MIIFKGKTDRMIRSLQMPAEFLVVTDENAWMTDDLMARYIEEIWLPHVYKMNQSESILTLDSFSAHVSSSTLARFRLRNIHTPVIPGDGQSAPRPVEVSLLKPFQGLLKAYCQQYMLSELEKLQETGKKRVPKPSRQLIVHWIEAAWHTIKAKQDSISRSFIVAGISDSFDADWNDSLAKNALLEEIERDMTEILRNEELAYQDSLSQLPEGSFSNDSNSEMESEEVLLVDPPSFADMSESTFADFDATIHC